MEEIRPQEGFQTKFLSSPADILIGGGSAGGGKTYALLIDPLRYNHVKDFGAVIFRRTTPQITNQGGLWDTASELYPFAGGTPKESKLSWNFGLSKLRFSHLEYEKDKITWQGSQIPYIGFDELTHFTEGQFFYLLSRNRSSCGIKPCVRAVCNPDPDSWVAEFLEWWIDQETGFPIPERDSVLRYFIKDADKYVWGDTKEEVIERCPHLFNRPEFKNINKDDLVKSVTFVRGDVYGNQKLLENNPQYLANLMSQDEVTKKQLLEGNWKISQDGLALCNFMKVNDLFSNFVEKSKNRYITCDVAGFGRDLAVTKVWEGFKVIKIVIFTKCTPDQLKNGIEKERETFKISKSNVLVDEDGLGWGLGGNGYIGFQGGHPALEDPVTKLKENYSNLKTQCAYRFSERINRGEVAYSLSDVIVNGKATDQVKIGNKIFSVKKLIKEDWRCFKREKPDMEGKKKMNIKEQQKSILGGRSPDFGDSGYMREYFELKPRATFYAGTV